MKRLLTRFETMMAAAAFAEAGEFETARQMMRDGRPRNTERPSAHKYQRTAARKEMRAD